MNKSLLSLCFVILSLPAYAQDSSDSTTNINNNTTTTSTVDSTSTSTNTNTNYNTNNNVNTSTSTNTNNNFNTNVSTNTNTNNNTNVSTNTNTNNNNTLINSNSTNNNNNNNVNNTTINSTTNSNSNVNQNINNNTTSNNTNTSTANNTNNNTNNNYNESRSDSNVTTSNENTNRNENINRSETTIKSPPPSAIAPSIGSSYSQDLCTTGISGAVQTQIFGVSGGKAVRDENCERIKLSKTLYDMGMKVAAVSLMCQDERVWNAMRMAGTPCPFEGAIGEEASERWDNNPEDLPEGVSPRVTTLESNDDIEYRAWTKADFCEEYPDEEICD